MTITRIFFDIGAVLGTNARDREQRGGRGRVQSTPRALVMLTAQFTDVERLRGDLAALGVAI